MVCGKSATPERKTVKKILLTLALALGFLVSPLSPAQSASALSGHPWTSCGASGWLGARICFDKSDQKIRIYGNGGSTPAYTLTAIGLSQCSPFVAEPQEHIVQTNLTTVTGVAAYCGTGDMFTQESTLPLPTGGLNVAMMSVGDHNLVEWFGQQDFDFLIVA